MLEYTIDFGTDKKQKPFLFIKNNIYCALGDDFCSLDLFTLKLHLKSILQVLNCEKNQNTIYGNICFKINIENNESKIFCYDEFLGKESTIEIFNMLSDLTNQMELFNLKNK